MDEFGEKLHHNLNECNPEDKFVPSDMNAWWRQDERVKKKFQGFSNTLIYHLYNRYSVWV